MASSAQQGKRVLESDFVKAQGGPQLAAEVATLERSNDEMRAALDVAEQQAAAGERPRAAPAARPRASRAAESGGGKGLAERLEEPIMAVRALPTTPPQKQEQARWRPR